MTLERLIELYKFLASMAVEWEEKEQPFMGHLIVYLGVKIGGTDIFRISADSTTLARMNEDD